VSQRLTTEYRARVYDDDHGFYVEVRDDRDGLGLAEIVYSDGDKEAVERVITLGWGQAEKLAEAILNITRIRPQEQANDPR
jgi:hypothetical protein